MLFTNDQLARGIDFKDIKLIIQFDPPKDFETYIHRCGRAGRQHRGECVTLYQAGDREGCLKQITGCLRLSGEMCEGYSQETVQRKTVKTRKAEKKQSQDDDDDGLYEDLSSEEQEQPKKRGRK